MPKSLLSKKDCPTVSNPIRGRNDWVLIENEGYELKSRTDNELVADFNTLDSAPYYFLEYLALKFPCCSIRLDFCSDWDQAGCYEICSDGKRVHVIEIEADDIYSLRDNYQRAEDEWDGEFAWAVLCEEEHDEYHEQEYIREEDNKFWEWVGDFELSGLKERNELVLLTDEMIAECYDYENGIKRIPKNDWETKAWMDKYRTIIKKYEEEWENELRENEREWDYVEDCIDDEEIEKERRNEYYDDYEEYCAELDRYYEEWHEFEMGYDVMCAYEEQISYKSDFPLYFGNIDYIYDTYDDQTCYYDLEYYTNKYYDEMSYYWDPIDFINFDDEAL